jgi:hypothetical protein
MVIFPSFPHVYLDFFQLRFQLSAGKFTTQNPERRILGSHQTTIKSCDFMGSNGDRILDSPFKMVFFLGIAKTPNRFQPWKLCNVFVYRRISKMRKSDENRMMGWELAELPPLQWPTAPLEDDFPLAILRVKRFLCELEAYQYRLHGTGWAQLQGKWCLHFDIFWCAWQHLNGNFQITMGNSSCKLPRPGSIWKWNMGVFWFLLVRT